MSTPFIYQSKKEELLKAFQQNYDGLTSHDPSGLNKHRSDAIENFQIHGFPSPSLEKWKTTALQNTLEKDFELAFPTPVGPIDIHSIFRCEIHNFETFLFTQLNQNYIYNQSPLTRFSNGIIVGSLMEAFKQEPVLIEKYFNQVAQNNESMTALNTAFSADGFFIYVPDNVVVEKPVQFVHLVNTSSALLLQPRNLIILGKNSKLTLLQCDDAINQQFSFINAVSEYFLEEHSTLEHYKLQNKDELSTLLCRNYFSLKDHAQLNTTTITLNGGLIRNETDIIINGSHCDVNAFGLYLMDNQQQVDTHLFIDHRKPDSTSRQLFKGIVDDEASAIFNGHVRVAPDAQRTQAFQQNRNILLSESAKADTQPFLEIYADDVKCSHGATVGQLDANALFYLRSRGICDRTARMLLMYAFGIEVVNHISIDVLRKRIDKMVEKRLRGELSICDQCVLHCTDEKQITFNIDLTKIP